MNNKKAWSMPTTPIKQQNAQSKLLEKRIELWKSVKGKYNYVFNRSEKQQTADKTTKISSGGTHSHCTRQLNVFNKRKQSHADCKSQKISLFSQNSKDRAAAKQMANQIAVPERLKQSFISRVQTVEAHRDSNKDCLTARTTCNTNVPFKQTERSSLERVDNLISK